jgi:hypothetical protein
MVNVDMSPNNKVKELTLQVITDKRPGHFVIDDVNVIDSGASVTLFNPNSKRLIPPMISVHPPMEIKGVGGKPFLVKHKCSAYIHYTDVSGKRNTFILSNVYVCSAVRVPLISVSHLVSRDCEVHMTKSGHSIIFPDKSVSELVTMRNGLITLMPYSSKECRSMIADFHKRDNDRQANLVQVMETNHETNISVVEDMTTDPDMPALTQDIQSDSSSEESFTDDENETIPDLVSDHAYDSYDSDEGFITEEDESINTSSDDVQASITLKEANNENSQYNSNLCASQRHEKLKRHSQIISHLIEAHDKRQRDNVITLNKTYSLLNKVEQGFRNILITNLKGSLNWMWMVPRGRGLYLNKSSKKSTNMDNLRTKVNNEIKEMVAKVSMLTLEEATPDSKDVGCNTSATEKKKTFTETSVASLNMHHVGRWHRGGECESGYQG